MLQCSQNDCLNRVLSVKSDEEIAIFNMILESFAGLAALVSLKTVISILLAICLSAATGFRVSIPFLLISLVSDFGHLNLPDNADWVASDQALVMFAVATVLEVFGYYIPWVDHALDFVSTPLAVIAGTFITLSVAPDMNPLIQWTLALAAGGGTAGLTKSLLNIFRVSSTAISGGLTNPVLATIELIGAIALTLLAITVPVAGGLLVLLFLPYAFYRIWSFLFRRKLTKVQTTKPQPS